MPHLPCLMLVYIVCQCPFYGMLGLNGLINFEKKKIKVTIDVFNIHVYIFLGNKEAGKGDTSRSKEPESHRYVL